MIQWDPALGSRIAQEITVLQLTNSGAADTQGYEKFDLAAFQDQKTNVLQSQGGAYLAGKGIDVTKDLVVFIKLV